MRRGLQSRSSTVIRRALLSTKTTAARKKLLLEVPDFANHQVSTRSKTLFELFRAHLVFRACRIPMLVAHAEKLLKYSYRYVGADFTDSLLRWSFFGQFCAGEDEIKIAPTVDYLARNGIGPILDYAAESDVTEEKEATEVEKKVECRSYSYKDEEACDKHAETFEKCIRAVKQVSPAGFAALKITALGNPALLKQASTALNELRGLFAKFDKQNNGQIGLEDFQRQYDLHFATGSSSEIFRSLDKDGNGKIDIIEWTNTLQLEDLHLLTKHCRSEGPLSKSVLDEEERILLKKMRDRVNKLAKLAQELGVRLMIDAEHTYFNPAIDNLAHDLARSFNSRDRPTIFNTYQMYLKDSRTRLNTDMERARRGGYFFACKLVRGAYLGLERQHAKEHGLEDPTHATIDETHNCYNSAVTDVIGAIGRGEKVEVMVATHNQQSVERALQAMKAHGLAPNEHVFFAQLLGMSDNLTFQLGAASFNAFKYVPFGQVREVMPYLIRRAQENSALLGGSKLELDITKAEIKRRLFG